MPTGENVSPERRMEVAFGAIKQLLLAISASLGGALEGLKVQADHVIAQTLTQHQQHLGHHNVEQTNVDPYKIVAWFGCAILEKVPCAAEDPKDGQPVCVFRQIGTALIDTMAGMLADDSEERIILPAKTRKLLLQMLIAEKTRKPEQGIWQNGLYAAFHCSVASLRAMTGGG
jgi:hypothetical protein